MPASGTETYAPHGTMTRSHMYYCMEYSGPSICEPEHGQGSGETTEVRKVGRSEEALNPPFRHQPSRLGSGNSDEKRESGARGMRGRSTLWLYCIPYRAPRYLRVHLDIESGLNRHISYIDFATSTDPCCDVEMAEMLRTGTRIHGGEDWRA